MCAKIATKPCPVQVRTLHNFGHCPSNLPLRNLKLGGNTLRRRRSAGAEKARKRLDDAWHHTPHFEQTLAFRMPPAEPHSGRRTDSILVRHPKLRDVTKPFYEKLVYFLKILNKV